MWLNNIMKIFLFILNIDNFFVAVALMNTTGTTNDSPKGNTKQLFGFLISPKTFDKQMVVYHSELNVLRFSKGTVSTWSLFLKKQPNHYFRNASYASNFYWIWSSLEDSYVRLLLAFGLICIYLRFVFYH